MNTFVLAVDVNFESPVWGMFRFRLIQIENANPYRLVLGPISDEPMSADKLLG